MIISQRIRLSAVPLVLVLAAALLLVTPGVASAQVPGPSNTITDVPGLKVGHYDRLGDGWRTGTTVILTETGATAGYSQLGGAPGTKETDLLKPGNLVERANAIVLSGGSAYGLDTTTGVMRWLEERGYGHPVGGGVVPIVPAAILFDLGRGGNFRARPDAEFGYRAADNASNAPTPQGRVGAGVGASRGLGTASVRLSNGYTVGAIVGLNPAGNPINPNTCLPLGAFLELDKEFNLAPPAQAECPQAFEENNPQPFNTTIAVVATDAPLNDVQAERMAMIANSGLSRSIRPVHGIGDGDTVFGIATTTPPSNNLSNNVLGQIYNAAADALGRAVVHTLLKSEGIGTSYCERYQSICQYFSGRGAYSREYCLKGGWQKFTNPVYSGQGQCVKDARKNNPSDEPVAILNVTSADLGGGGLGLIPYTDEDPGAGAPPTAPAPATADNRTLLAIAALLMVGSFALGLGARRLRPARRTVPLATRLLR